MNCPICGAEHSSAPNRERSTPAGGRLCPYQGGPYAGLRAGHDHLLVPEDADGLWNFLRQLPEIDKSHFHLAEVIEEQQAAVRALERMGFEKAAVYRNFVNDRKGDLHNLVVLLHPLSGLKK